MSQRRAVTKAIATRYRRADKAAKGVILDELCATTGWHRNYARKAMAEALKPKIVSPVSLDNLVIDLPHSDAVKVAREAPGALAHLRAMVLPVREGAARKERGATRREPRLLDGTGRV